MITKVMAFQVGDKTFASLEEAQASEIGAIIRGWNMPNGGKITEEAVLAIANAIVVARVEVIAILAVDAKRKYTMQSNGGKARAKRLSPARKSEIAKAAATARWNPTEGATPATPSQIRDAMAIVRAKDEDVA